MLKVNTDSLKKVALEIQSENNKIHNSFENLGKSVKELSYSWQGSNADHSIAAFDKVKTLEENRNKILINFYKVLNQTVAEQYELVENDNISLADLFK